VRTVRAFVETIVEDGDEDVILVRITTPDRTLVLEMNRDECMRFSNHLGGAIAYLWTSREVLT
jgi:hypothetical protein